MNKVFLFFCLFLFSNMTLAADSFGDLAASLSSVTTAIWQILRVILLIAGSYLVVSSGLKFRQYQKNPQNMPVSTFVTELVIGLCLLAVPAIAYLSQNIQPANASNTTAAPAVTAQPTPPPAETAPTAPQAPAQAPTEQPAPTQDTNSDQADIPAYFKQQ